MNLGQYERDFPEMAVLTHPRRRGFINEVSFLVFCMSVRKGHCWPFATLAEENISEALTMVRASPRRRELGNQASINADLTAEEIIDITQQHDRMMRIFTVEYPDMTLVPEPEFPGCGIIDSCSGDLLVGDILFEVKAGERAFLSIDIRQLVTYAALNSNANKFKIGKIGLFNPRVGMRAEFDLDELCFEISGKKTAELLSEIILSVSSGEISR